MENIVQGQWFRGPSADLGDTIDQSIRFDTATGNKTLQLASQTLGNTNWTLSFWMKIPFPAGPADYIFRATSLDNSAVGANLYKQTDGTIQNAQLTQVLSGVFRDPAAWYHFVYQRNADNTYEVFVNNVSRLSATDQNVSSSGTFTWDISHKQLADIWLVDGSVLAPTQFGKTNNAGVWVPIDYTGSIGGGNGFHLTLDSSQTNGIGHDSSGNGNHFTATGFDTADVVVHSAHVSTPASGFFASNGPAQLFDGSTVTFCQAAAAETYTFTPATPISYTSLEVWSAGAKFSLNGGAEQEPTDGSFQSLDNSSGTLTTLAFISPTGVAGAAVRAIRINGTTILTDNTDNDVDFNDTPTSNYARLNPLAAVPTTFSEADLKHGNSGTSAWEQATPTIHLTSGKWYWEVVADGSASWGIGIADQRWDINDNDNFIGGLAGSVGYNGANGNKHVDGTATSYGDTYTAGDIIGVALDLENNAVWFSKNGVWQASATQSEVEAGTTTNAAATGLTQEIYYPVCVNSGSGSNWKWNLGQMNFIYTQPTGFSALQTNNLPEPTIKNGKEHFGVLTYTGDGAGASGQTITDTDAVQFTPDLVWIKKRANNGGSTGLREHILVDSVRGKDGSYYWNLSTSDAQGETSNDHVSAIGEGSITVHDITAGTVNANLNTFVAWCWKAGTSFTPSQTGGLTNLSGSSNADAGFSIMQYTGSSSASTIGHNLNSAPEFIIVKDLDSNTFNWQVWHTKLSSADHSLLLNSAQSEADFNAWNNTAPTSSVVNLGGNISGVNTSNRHIMYCWHSVEGFSKFGEYTGNNSTDGPFVYLGFKPALLVIKCRTQIEDWFVHDNGRYPDNPSQTVMRWNTIDNESGTGNDIDLLSNGFKIRNTIADVNSNAHPFLYMAWAEHPFGGENQPPVTAR